MVQIHFQRGCNKEIFSADATVRWNTCAPAKELVDNSSRQVRSGTSFAFAGCVVKLVPYTLHRKWLCVSTENYNYDHNHNQCYHQKWIIRMNLWPSYLVGKQSMPLMLIRPWGMTCKCRRWLWLTMIMIMIMVKLSSFIKLNCKPTGSQATKICSNMFICSGEKY